MKKEDDEFYLYLKDEVEDAEAGVKNAVFEVAHATNGLKFAELRYTKVANRLSAYLLNPKF